MVNIRRMPYMVYGWYTALREAGLDKGIRNLRAVKSAVPACTTSCILPFYS